MFICIKKEAVFDEYDLKNGASLQILRIGRE